MWLALQLYKRNVINSEQLCTVVEYCFSNRPTIGELAVKSGRISIKGLFRILERQSDDDRPFGVIACELGLLNETDIRDLLFQQFEQMPAVSVALIENGILSDQEIHAQIHQSHQLVEKPHSESKENWKDNQPVGTAQRPLTMPNGRIRDWGKTLFYPGSDNSSQTKRTASYCVK